MATVTGAYTGTIARYKYGAGDKVKVRNPCSGCVPGPIYTLHWQKYGQHPTDTALFAYRAGVAGSGCSCVENWLLVKPATPVRTEAKRSMTIKLTSMLKRLLDKDGQTLYKAGYLNDKLELTFDGSHALMGILFEKHKEALVKQAQARLDEEKAK